MPASEAQILANRRNAERSTGPKTAEGKERSRANALKHGLTGEGVVMTPEDAAEVERLSQDLEAELKPEGTVEHALVRRVATCIVRMDRSVAQETAAIDERVRRAEADAEAKGEDPVEAGHRALFDPSKEASLARKYEAASERGMYRALKELRQLRKESSLPSVKSEAAAIRKQIEQAASIFPALNLAPVAPKTSVTPSLNPPKPATPPPVKSTKTVFPAWRPAFSGSVDVPITIGRAR